MLIEYSSNNSGGRWWLNDAHWRMLEEAGWYVEWGTLYFCGSTFDPFNKPEGKPDCGLGKDCKGHRKFESYRDMTDADRYLGALAKAAHKEFPTVRDALLEFERITGQQVSEEGCGCCGPPHSFSWQGDYCSGDGCLEHLYDNMPASYQEAVERLNAK